MPLIRPVKGIHPTFGKNCFLAENATIVGDVEIGNDCSVWFNAVIRGDVNSIRIGDKVNIQDGAVVHCTYQKTKSIIGLAKNSFLLELFPSLSRFHHQACMLEHLDILIP